MLQVLRSAWALLLGMMLLMVGNGLQGTLIGVRGDIEGFSTLQLSIITSAYFVGFLGGSRLTPQLIRRVGHVRVFAALGSFVSAILILYPSITDPWAWTLFRVVFGFCFSGVYVTAESWLNNASSNENRGKALSLYMVVQTLGIVISQGLMNVGDPAGYALFVIPSVLVSISFAPILLSVSPTPTFETTKPMSLRELYTISPTSFVGMCLLGAVFSAQFGMGAVYGTAAGLSVGQISIFMATIFFGGALLQVPIGWLSDRMDRRVLIFGMGVAGVVSGIIGVMAGTRFELILVAALLLGSVSNPLYALLIAYANDYLEVEDMAAASGGLVFLSGVGAIMGPMLTGWALSTMGPDGFWAFLGGLMAAIAAYVAYRMTQRPSVYADAGDDYDPVSYSPITPAVSPVAVEVAQEVYIENALEDDSATVDEPVDNSVD